MDAVNAAAITGNLPLLKEIASTVELRRFRGFKGRNLLHLAVEGSCVTGWLDVCTFLVEEKGFDANSTSTEGETPIFVTTDADCRLLNGAENGAVPLLTYFLGRGGDPAAPDARGHTPLHNAAQYGHSDAIRLLLYKGVPVDPFNHHGTPLHLAAGNGHDKALKILLDHGADPNKLVHQVTPLIMACAGAPMKCIKLWLEAGANVNFHSSPGPTMLLAAVGAGSADVVNFLLKIGADPNVHDGEVWILIIESCREATDATRISLRIVGENQRTLDEQLDPFTSHRPSIILLDRQQCMGLIYQVEVGCQNMLCQKRLVLFAPFRLNT